MQNVPSLIVWLPLLGFFFNAFLGKRLGPRVVSYVAPGVVLAAFAVTLYTLIVILPTPEHLVTSPAKGYRFIAPMIPFTSPETPWINFAGFRVNFALLIDPLSMLMALIVTGVGGLIHIYATGYMAEDKEQPRFFTYFNLFIFMMLLLVLGENFLLMFVGWEGVGSCSYLLISFWYRDVNNSLAGNKAFIVNRVGDLGFALGMMLIWSIFGTLSFFTTDQKGVMDLAKLGTDVSGHQLSALTASNGDPLSFFGMSVVTAICILLFIGAMGKSAQIPLWVWLPDAMAGPTPVSALIHAATMVTAGVVMLTRCSWLFVLSPGAMQTVAWVGVLTAFMGATIGLVQNDIKRVLAFSTVSQLGYMFLACGVGNFTAGMFHVTTHAFFKALLFLGSGAVIHSMLGEQDMRKMGGLQKLIPTTWKLMLIGTYAIAGVPLMAGFFSKDEILESASTAGGINGYLFYGLGLLTALMTAFYMNRLMWKTFYTEPRFVDGELPHQHHSNEEDHSSHSEHTGHEATTEGHDAHSAQEHDAAHGHDAHGGGKVHESPPSMLNPLFVLAALSIAAGLILGPTHWFDHFLESSIAKPPALEGGEHHSFLPALPWSGYIISSLIAIAGLSLAAMRYKAHLQTGELQTEEEKQKNLIYRILMDKWGFDRAYNFVFINVGGQIADTVLWRFIDVKIIDGFANGLARVVEIFSKGSRRLQTGYVRNYALAMLLGVVVLVVSLFLTWNKIQSLQH